MIVPSNRKTGRANRAIAPIIDFLVQSASGRSNGGRSNGRSTQIDAAEDPTALASLETKRDRNPPKKHGNIPL